MGQRHPHRALRWPKPLNGLYTTAAGSLLDDGLAPLPVLTATLGLGAVITLPVLLAGGRALLVPVAAPVLAWLCLAATALAYASFAAGLRTLRAGTVGTLALAEPLLATVLCLLVLTEGPQRCLARCWPGWSRWLRPPQRAPAAAR